MKHFKTILFLIFVLTLPATGVYGQSWHRLKKLINKEAAKSNVEATSTDFGDVTTKDADDDVTLVVSGDGATKEEAIKSALRSAIEQTYGTFVSANTSLLNDELVRDEIVTISSGNIKNYSEIACEQTPNGRTFITLKATVSISRLVSYAESKGASVEFAGAAFGMQMKMLELNKKNEEIAMKNLAKQVSEMVDYFCSYELTVGEPVVDTESDDQYLLTFNVTAKYNTQLIGTIYQTLSSLSLSDEDQKYYEAHNMRTYQNVWSSSYGEEVWESNRGKEFLYFRSELSENLLAAISDLIAYSAFNFEIVDNLGNICSVKKILHAIEGRSIPILTIVTDSSEMEFKVSGWWRNNPFILPVMIEEHSNSEVQIPPMFTYDFSYPIKSKDLSKYSTFTIRCRENKRPAFIIYENGQYHSQEIVENHKNFINILNDLNNSSYD